MPLFSRCRACEAYEKANLGLRAELSDNRELILKVLAQNKELTDRILALAQPVALREYRREPESRERQASGPPRPRFPGLAPISRPPLAAPPSPEGEPAAEILLDAAIKRLNG